MATKICFVCNIEKDLESFYRHPKMADGFLNRCKECHKSAVTANRNANIERYRQYDLNRAKEPSRKKASIAISTAWVRADKRRMSAHNAVTRAVRAGSLVRKPCERCGSVKSMAHHESYDRKLDVVWLCQPCHKQRHKEMVLAGLEP